MRLLSLFSGIGAFEKALTNIGVDYELVGFSEINKWAIQSYCAIHGVDESLNLGDVSCIDSADLPKTDLITYGFPCQDISIVGKQKGIGTNTRSGLLYEAERIIRDVQPKYAIAENVKNLVGKRHKEDFQKLLDRLEGYGYNNYWKVLNAKDYGVPQSRERVFIVSIRKDVDSSDFSFPTEKGNADNLYDVLDKNVPNKYILNMERFEKDITDEVKQDYTSKESYSNIIQLTHPKFSQQRVYSPWGIAPTIPAGNRGGGKEPCKMLFTSSNDKSLYIRKLTPLECWRLMGFDDRDYWLARKELESTFYNGRDSSDSQMYKQAGNSIVVPVLEEIFKELFK